MEIMNEMTKYDRWFEEQSRTIRSRGIVFTREEMDTEGILEIINYEAVLDDGLNDMERMHSLIRRGVGQRLDIPLSAMDLIPVCERTKAVLVDTAMRSVRGNYIRVYSGIVFRNEYMMNLYVLKREDDYPDVLLMPRLSN